MNRRRASSAVLSAYSRTLQDIPEDELMFIKATELGDLGTVRMLLEKADESTATRLINCIDVRDRTPSEIATENEHLDIVEYIINNWARMVSYETVHECIMLAISKGYTRITIALLNHPVYQRNRGTLNRLGTITNYYQRVNHSKFDQDVTPLMLAAHCNEVDIIRIFLQRGETVKKPHMSSCECNYCQNRRKFDPLKHSKSAIHAYRALASPAYISLTSNDPILTAFILSEELSKLAQSEKEFKNEYRELVHQCKKYTSDLMDMCQNSKEVSLILNKTATTQEELTDLRTRLLAQGADDRNSSQSEDYQGSTLERLKLALLYNQKQFVAHPHCQHHLATIWYDSFPGWRRLAAPIKILLPPLMYFTCPIWGIIYWIAPESKLGRIFSGPLAKFATHTVAYLCFLMTLFLQAVFSEMNVYPFIVDPYQDDTLKDRFAKYPNEREACEAVLVDLADEHADHTHDQFKFRRTGINSVDVVIIIFLAGMFWGEVKQIWVEGYSRYLASGWNWIDICMLNLYFSAYFMKMVSHFKNHSALVYLRNEESFCQNVQNNDTVALGHRYYLSHERKFWKSSDPIFVCEALFAFANVLSFSRLSYILPINEFLGPLQISLGRMMGDILRFGAVFSVVFLAFFCSFLNLYWFLGTESNFGTFVNTLLTLFWSLFGMVDRTAPDVKETLGNFSLTSGFGTVLFAIYHIVMDLVMLNMLIAMMSNSFEEIESEEDVEWKFARAKLWMSYVEKGATLPLPFNVIPSPKSFARIYRWLCKPIEKHCFRKRRHRRQENIQLANRSVYIALFTEGPHIFFNLPLYVVFTLYLQRTEAVTIVTKSDSTHVERRQHENIMKAIVKRYLFQLQRSKENDEVNEGELDEIKNDISSLRFELIQLLNGDIDSQQTSQPNRRAEEDDRTSTATEDPHRGKRKPVKLKPKASSLDEEDKKKLDQLEKKIDQLGKDMRHMQQEILKTLGRRSVSFKAEDDYLVI